MKKTRLIGPPGTGKTTYLLGIIKSWIEQGVEPSRIAFLSFSKAAIQEARDRVLGAIPESEIPTWKTLHATAFKALEYSPGGIFQKGDLIEFGRKYDYHFSMATVWSKNPSEASNDADALLLAYHFGRSTMTESWAETAETIGGDLREDELASFARQLEAYKKELGKIDFHDLLSKAIECRAVPAGITHVVLDEAQDLTPHQWEYFRLILEDAQPEAVHVACDPQQTIYGFSGCDPRLLDTFEVDEEVVLRQSHRLPDQLVRFARSICPEAVEYYGRPTDADHLTLKAKWDGVIEKVRDGRRTLVLCRSNWIVAQAAQDLASKGIDYSTRMGDELTAGRQALGHMYLAHRSNGPYSLPVGALYDMVEALDSRACKMPRGYKTELNGEACSNPGAPRNLIAEPWFKGIQRTLELNPAVLFKRTFRRQIPRLMGIVNKSGGEAVLREPTVTVMTIHQAKGKEADRVVLIPVLPKRVYESLHGFDQNQVQRNRDGEKRLWYVGATRAKEELIVVNPYDRAFAAMNEYVLPKKPEPVEEVL